MSSRRDETTPPTTRSSPLTRPAVASPSRTATGFGLDLPDSAEEPAADETAPERSRTPTWTDSTRRRTRRAEDDAFSVAATIVADGDFVEEPEFAVPDVAAPPSTRRNARRPFFRSGRAGPAAGSARARSRGHLHASPARPRRAGARAGPGSHATAIRSLTSSSSAARPVRCRPPCRRRRRRPPRTGRPHRHRKAPRRPAFGLPALLVFALAAAFFAWVSATPLLLTAGHGKAGASRPSRPVRCTGIDRRLVPSSSRPTGVSRAAVTLLGPASTHAERRAEARRADGVARAATWPMPATTPTCSCTGSPESCCSCSAASASRGRPEPCGWPDAGPAAARLGSFGGPLLLFAGMLAYAW